jgi:uncharacterized protein YjdB
MAQHRPIEERLEALQAQMLTLQAKAQKEALAQHPEVAQIDEAIASENNDALKWKRWSKDSEAKVASFTARVEEWKTRGEEADTYLEEHSARLADLKAQREKVIANILSD